MAIVNKIASRTVLIIVLALSSYWFLHPQGLIFQVFNKDLSFLLSPILVASIIFYLSSLISVIFTGRIINIITSSLKGFSTAFMFFLLISNPPTSEALRPIGFWLLICALIVIFHHVVSSVAQLYHEPLPKVFATSLSLFAGGLALSQVTPLIPISLPWNLGSSLDKIVLLGFALASIASLFGVFKDFSNPYLRYLGEKLGSNLFSVLELAIFVLLYFFNIRSYLIDMYPVYIPLPLIEWGVVCMISWSLYRKLKHETKVSLSEPLKLGDWTRLQQKVGYHMDQELIDVSKLTEEFVEDGAKEGILVYITTVLLMNNVEQEAIEKVVSKLVDYQDTPYPRIALSWGLKGVEEENKERRTQLLQAVLEGAQSEILALRVISHRVHPNEWKYESGMEA